MEVLGYSRDEIARLDESGVLSMAREAGR